MNYLENHYSEIFKKYSDEELIQDVESFKYRNGRLTKVLNQFFEECIFKCCGKKTKISPYEVLQNDELMEKILKYIESKPRFFTSPYEVANVKSCLRNSMSWVRKVANFPPKEARDIYFRYFPDYLNRPDQINCLDTSCGFGSRMSAVLLSGHNYFGIDPNIELQSKLKDCKNFYYKNNLVDQYQICQLYPQGSEIFIPQIKSIIDVSFTSPPYFNLEKYSNDNSKSTENYDNYSAWVEEFVYPTVKNTYEYLKIGGYAMVNIKNISKKETCFDDFFNAFNKIDGFEFVEIFDMQISKKQYGMNYNNEKGVILNKEPVMCFRKVK